MKVLITGSTGFIGSHLVKRLTRTEHKLYCLVRETSNTGELKRLGVTTVTGDVTNKSSLLGGMSGCDWLVHLAGTFEFWVPNRHVYKEVNIDGMRNVMECALETGVRKIILVSTVAAYGNAEWPITEKSRFGPDCPSEYARSKRAGETIAWELYEAKRLPLVVIYPGAVIGANDPKATGRYIRNIAHGHLPAQIARYSTFPFVDVKDVCEAILLALEKKGNVGEKYIVAKHNLTFGELNKMICELAGSKPPLIKMSDPLALLTAYVLTGLANLIRKPPIWDMSIDQTSLMEQGFWVDGSKTERELGLTYKSLRDGIEEAITSYRV
jgi:dihydroflavonol-4-reductase